MSLASIHSINCKRMYEEDGTLLLRGGRADHDHEVAESHPDGRHEAREHSVFAMTGQAEKSGLQTNGPKMREPSPFPGSRWKRTRFRTPP